MADRSGANFIRYSDPRPFVVPTEENRQTGIFQVTPIPKRFLPFASSQLEEIMYELDQEYDRRGTTKPTWKKYLRSTTDFTTFTPDREGSNLLNACLDFFAQYIKDIQDAIDGLMNDSDIPDTRAAFLARTFANNQGIPASRQYDSTTKLRDSINIPASGTTIVVDPLSRAQAGLWPFDHTVIDQIDNILGVDLKGNKQHNLDVPASDFPQSVIGQIDADGNVPGFDIAMTPDNRPTLGSRAETNSLGTTVGDEDQGYSYIGPIAHMVQQVRWQPPQIEFFPNNQTPRDFTTNLVNNQTGDINWVLAQPTEQNTQQAQNWGFWFIKGFVGIENNQAVIRAYPNPSVQASQTGICPFAVFFPPPVAQCSCGGGDSAFFIWHSSDFPGFSVDEIFPIQFPEFAKQKKFNRNTRLKVKATITSDGGDNTTVNEFTVGVKTARIGTTDVPFTTVIRQELGTGSIDTVFDINLMDAIQAELPWYTPGGIDGILALKMEVKTRTFAAWECDAEDGPGGRFLPDDCETIFICNNPDTTARVDYVWLDEEGLASDPVDSYI